MMNLKCFNYSRAHYQYYLGDYTRLWCYSLEYENWLELGNIKDIPLVSLFAIIGLPDHSVVVIAALSSFHDDRVYNCKFKPGEICSNQMLCILWFIIM